MARNVHKYTVQESQNTGLGQAGSAFTDDTSNTLTPVSGIFVAITVIEQATFHTLTSADGAGVNFVGMAASDSAANSTVIDGDNTFSAGTTFFGRWNAIRVASGSIVAYLGS